MREQTKTYIEEFLTEMNSFFHSEQEIQMLLVQHLRNTGEYSNVFIEYYVPVENLNLYPWVNERKISIDIVVNRQNVFLPIEIKYKTKQQILNEFIFGEELNVELHEHGAKNENCYYFWKDVKRNELLLNSFNRIEENGLTLFITNDDRYKNEPRKFSQYAPFSIHQNKEVDANTQMSWDETNGAISDDRRRKFPSFSLINAYKISWQNMGLENHIFTIC
ncbi:MAG: hypothetical protein HND52_15560 [Ignavibacteriae bacterium]|nr:hypothetical protein [Ignavibacteriota bacterium]NOG99373.1 hypothetical protein [Ignavibacteriota bacterium]